MTTIFGRADGCPSQIELITRYCSDLGVAFGYPYYFSWGFPTNYRVRLPVGWMDDIGYVRFSVGRYPSVPEGTGPCVPVERLVVFGPVSYIVAGGWVASLTGGDVCGSESKDDLLVPGACVESVKLVIDKFLGDLLHAQRERHMKEHEGWVRVDAERSGAEKVLPEAGLL